jgi:hypothetical protein
MPLRRHLSCNCGAASPGVDRCNVERSSDAGAVIAQRDVHEFQWDLYDRREPWSPSLPRHGNETCDIITFPEAWPWHFAKRSRLTPLPGERSSSSACMRSFVPPRPGGPPVQAGSPWKRLPFVDIKRGCAQPCWWRAALERDTVTVMPCGYRPRCGGGGQQGAQRRG